MRMRHETGEGDPSSPRWQGLHAGSGQPLGSCDQRRRAVRGRRVLAVALGLGGHLLLQRQQLVHEVLHHLGVLLLLGQQLCARVALVRRHVCLELGNLLVLGEQLLVLEGDLLLQRGDLLAQLGQHHHVVAAGRVQQAAAAALGGALAQSGASIGQLSRVQPWFLATAVFTADLVVGEGGRRGGVLSVVVVVLASRGGGRRARGGPVVVAVVAAVVAAAVAAVVAVVGRRGRAGLAQGRVPHGVVLLRLGEGPLVRQRAQPAQQLAVHLSAAVILAVEGAALLALLAVHGRPVPLLRVGAALALVANEGRNDVAVLARRRLSICLDILLTLLADGGCATFVFLLELCTAVGALDYRERTPTVFTKLLPLREFFERVTSVASCASEQRRGHIKGSLLGNK